MNKPIEGLSLRKAIREDAELDITPMIDIVFLLLAFFVVVSKMDPTTAVDLPKAQYGFTVPEKNCVVFVVTQGLTPQTAFIYQGRGKEESSRIPDGDPIEQEAMIADYVEQQLSARPEVTAILIKAEANVRTGAVESVKRGIAGSELGREREIYVGVEEDQ
jgi:biopolymer transport protein ExbD